LEGPDFGREVSNINAEIFILRTVGSMNKEHWQKVGIYVYRIKYNEKWKSVVIKKNRLEINLDEK
jgi:hypothetical protein